MTRSPLRKTQMKRGDTQLKRVRLARRRALVAKGKLRAGKKTKEWNKVRAKLKTEHEKQELTTCELRYEGCWIDNALGFAHGRKRRKLQGDELETLTILACNSCHDKIEYLGPERMLEIVEQTIARRAA